jgi:hypothetical protein
VDGEYRRTLGSGHGGGEERLPRGPERVLPEPKEAPARKACHGSRTKMMPRVAMALIVRLTISARREPIRSTSIPESGLATNPMSPIIEIAKPVAAEGCRGPGGNR